MRGVQCSVAVAAFLLSAVAAAAQSPSKDMLALPKSATEPLEKGTLVVWFVEPATQLEKAQIAQRRDAPKKMLPTTVQESTAGSFGQTAGSVGQTAGSYGVSPSQVGTNASNAGKPASEHGTTAGNFGQNAGSAGQNAGSVGQTAGSFGQAASSVGTTAGNYANSANWGSDKRQNQAEQEERWDCATRTPAATRRMPEWRTMGFLMCDTFHELHLHVMVVPIEDAEERLKRAEGTEDYPDVIFGTQKLPWWNQSGYGLTMLGWPAWILAADEHGGMGGTGYRVLLQMGLPVILRKAPHRDVAEALVVWLREQETWPPSTRRGGEISDNSRKASQVAASALGSIIDGGGLAGLADAHAAVFDGRAAQMEALMPSTGEMPEGLNSHIDVMQDLTNTMLSVVILRGIVSSPQSFGVVDALAVLRKDTTGAWKVLQITPNRWVEDLERTASKLDASFGGNPAKPVNAVSLASPIDADVRSMGTELWWDNDGSAMVQVVEWQMCGETKCANPHLFPVVDTNPHTQTRVAPDFTRMPGSYRWRVWSMGWGGMVVFTPWRKLTITP